MSRLTTTWMFCLLSLFNIYLAFALQDNEGSLEELPTHEVISISLKLPAIKYGIELLHKDDCKLLNSILANTATRTNKSVALFIHRAGSNHLLMFHLTQSPLLLPKNLKLVSFDLHDDDSHHKYIDVQNASYFYSGYGEGGTNQTLSYFNLCCEDFEGEVFISGQLYVIKMEVDVENRLIITMRRKLLPTTVHKCGHTATVHSEHDRVLRNAEPRMHPPAMSNISTRYIEMYVVVDHNLYLRSGSDEAKAVQRVLKIIHYASSLYRKLNMFVALVGIEMWKTSDRIKVTGYADQVLLDFERYRRTIISLTTPNDNAQLLVAESFEGNKIGLSSSTICSHVGGAALTADHYEDDWVPAATTLVHELGHNLGLDHDDELPNSAECTCPQPNGGVNCIMFSYSSSTQPVDWSQCSIQTLQRLFTSKSTDYCLRNLPEILQSASSCGDYFVDEDEECDCGPSEECDSQCCEPQTCKLVEEAQCASGACCDIKTCKLRFPGILCRQRADNQCDLPEYCNGESEWCPQDTHIYDGSECSAVSPSYCYSGRCRSRDTQCTYVWGDDSTVAIDECYTVWNLRGEYYGHCGYSVAEVTPSPLPEYNQCDTAEDTFCGMLHCFSPNRRGVLGLSVYVDYYYTNMTVNSIKHRCKFVVFDVGLHEFDPGMVPEGSACGLNKWCRSQHCVDIPTVPQNCSCHERGVCNQLYHCHCDSGYDFLTNCSTPGSGGSVDSGPLTPSNSPTSGSTSSTTPQWVRPLVASLVSIAVVAALGVAAVIKRRQLLEFINSKRSQANRSGGRQLSNEGNRQLNDTKISSPTLSTDNINGRPHDLISNPVLESTTNTSIDLCDILVPPNRNARNISTSNPIYYSDIDFTLPLNAPVRDVDMCEQVIGEVDDNTYSEYHFGDLSLVQYDDDDQSGGEEQDDGYEDIDDATSDASPYRLISTGELA